MSHLSQATSQSISGTRRCGYADASGGINGPTIIGDPPYVDQYTAAYHPQTSTIADTDVSDSPTSSYGSYNSASDWLKKKEFGASRSRRSEAPPLQRQGSPTAQKERPPPESMDAWFKRHFEPDKNPSRQVRDNTLRHLEYPSHPDVFHIYSQGRPGISIQMLLSKFPFDRSSTALGRLMNFRLVNPPVHFKLPDGTYAQRVVGSVKISDTMTIHEYCIKIAGKMGTSLDRWDVKDLTIVSLELSQDSVVCFLGTTCSPAI